MTQHFEDRDRNSNLPESSKDSYLEGERERYVDYPDFSYNSWKYYVPHAWPTERTTWEDLYLMPDDPLYRGGSIWLTVDAVRRSLDELKLGWGIVGESEEDPEKLEFAMEDFAEYQKRLEQTEKLGFYLDDNNNLDVPVADFSKEELLGWVAVFLKAKGVEMPILRAAPLSDFEGSNQHACEIERAKEIREEFRRELGEGENHSDG